MGKLINFTTYCVEFIFRKQKQKQKQNDDN